MESNQTTPHKVKQKSNCHVPPSIPTFFGDAIFSLNTNRQRDTKTVNSFFLSRLFTQRFHFSPKKNFTPPPEIQASKPRELVTVDVFFSRPSWHWQDSLESCGNWPWISDLGTWMSWELLDESKMCKLLPAVRRYMYNVYGILVYIPIFDLFIYQKSSKCRGKYASPMDPKGSG